MTRWRALVRILALALAAAPLLAVPGAAADEPHPGATADLIVATNPSIGRASVVSMVDEAGVVAEQRHGGGLSTIKVRAGDVGGVVAELRADPRVVYVEPDVQAHIVATPADRLYPQQWGLPLTRVPAAWDVTTGGSGVVIAVIDTGVHAAHPDLAGVELVAGYDFVNGDADPADDNGHGTAAAGVIAAQHNDIGTAGVCPRCAIMPLKAMGATGTGGHAAVAAAIHHAVDNGADIINLSLGSEASTNTLHTAVRRAQSAGVLVVAAAGNAGVTTPFYPAAYAEALGVAASDAADGRYSWSNHGSWVTLAAPGCNLAPAFTPATRLEGYTTFCGTSSAAPFAAGVAGLLAAAQDGVTEPTLTVALQTTAVPAPFVSAGRVDATAALAALVARDDAGKTGAGDAPSVTGPGDAGGGAAPPPAGPGPAPSAPTAPTAPGVTPPADAPIETATSVSASATSLRYGDTVDINGHVVSSAGSASGAMITLLGRPAGETTWTELAAQPADDAGAVVFTQTPLRITDYRLRFDGTVAQAASLSEVVTVAVEPVVTAAAPAAPALAGEAAVVTGALLPPHAGLDVVLQRRTASGWRQVQIATTGAGGTFRVAAIAAAGRSRYRVHVPATIALDSGESSPVVGIGERAALPRARADAPGDDRRNLNGEFIVLRNTGKTTVQLRGWTVRSASTRTTFSLPRYRLPAGEKVRIHSGRGPAGNGHLYLRAGREVWRNRHDTAVVRHVTGPVAARLSW